MNAKEYLLQARYLDTRINSKIQQIESLNLLASKATVAITGMPKAKGETTSAMEDVVVQILDLQQEIKDDIVCLIELKHNISRTIKALVDVEQQMILEKRYLCFLSWEEIAAGMKYDIRWVYRLHGKALEVVQEIIEKIA